MLWLTLASLIAIDPTALAASSQTGQVGPVTSLSAQAPRTPRPAAPELGMRALPRLSPPACVQFVMRVDSKGRILPSPPAESRVRLYRLFALNDAQGCPIPVIARDVVPEADAAIGRLIP